LLTEGVIPIGDCGEEKNEETTDPMSQQWIEFQAIRGELENGEGAEDEGGLDIAAKGMNGSQQVKTRRPNNEAREDTKEDIQ
jgi:hypothetical protein